MNKIIAFVVITASPFANTLAMRYVPRRTLHHPVVRPLPLILQAATHAPVIKVPIPKTVAWSYSGNRANAEHTDAWLKIKADVDQRVKELKARAKKHHGLANRHTHYARNYEQLADLEKTKYELFKSYLEKLATAALYFEEPDVQTEAQILETLYETSAQLHSELPKDDKI